MYSSTFSDDAKNATPAFFDCSSLAALDPGSDGKSRRYAMIPALGMVILPKNPSTENGHVPGWSCILSVDGPYKGPAY